MQVSKWGNSLAVRLPVAVVESLGLKEGDEIEISIAGAREMKVARDRTREKAIESLRRRARPLPAGFKFDREEANEKLSWNEIALSLNDFREICETPVPMTIQIHEGALEIARRYGYTIYDSLVIAAAVECGCHTLYSEDMGSGQNIRGLTIHNPFPASGPLV